MPIKVLMFGWEFPPHNSGGLGVACFGLARGLARRNVNITFVLPKPVNIHSDFLKLVFADGTSIVLKEVSSTLRPYLSPAGYAGFRTLQGEMVYGENLLEEVKSYARSGRLIAENSEFDVIHAHDWLSFGAGIEAKRASGKPLVVHVHATEFDRTGGNSINQLVYEMEKEGMEAADQVIAVSEFTKKTIVRHYGIPAEKVRVVHNGIDLKDYSCASLVPTLASLKETGARIVLFVGRITLQKGPDYFLEAARIVLEHHPDVYFVITGSGDMEGEIVQKAAHMNISHRVLFAGFLRGDELSAIYRAADIFVMPSVSEPFGITTLEALAHGTPVLVSRQSGVAEVITHALKADFWDIHEMANKIISVLRYDPLKNCLAKEGGKEVSSLDWDRSARSCIDVYKNMLKIS